MQYKNYAYKFIKQLQNLNTLWLPGSVHYTYNTVIFWFTVQSEMKIKKANYLGYIQFVSSTDKYKPEQST